MKNRSVSLCLLAGFLVSGSVMSPLKCTGQTSEPTQQEHLAAKLHELDVLNDDFEKKHQILQDTHPDILALKAKIAGVKQDIARLRSETGRPETHLRPAQERLQDRRVDLDNAQKQLNIMQAKVNAGLSNQESLFSLQTDIKHLELEMARLEIEAEAEKQTETLHQKIDNKLNRANLQQCAAAIEKATRVVVFIDKNAAADESIALTIDAEQVSLASVLEAIAEKTDLMIAPAKGGVVLRRWPRLNEHIYRGANAPWSDDWSTIPTAPPLPAGISGGGMAFGGGPGGFPGGGGGFGGGRGDFGQPRNGNLIIDSQGRLIDLDHPERFAPVSPPAITMTNLGDHLIAVAEPGKDASGVSGIWITVYRLDAGNQLKKLSTVFHRLQPAAKPASQTTPKKSMLLEEIKKRDLEAVRSLLDSGADPNERQTDDKAYAADDGLPALVFAVNAGSNALELTRILLEKGADPGVRYNKGSSVIMEAACVGNNALVNALLEKGADVNAHDADGRTALMYAARFGHPETAKLLIERGADINARTIEGSTALMDAISFETKVETVKTLLDRRPRINLRNKEGYTALDVALKYGRSEMAVALRKAGGKQNKPTPKPDPRSYWGLSRGAPVRSPGPTREIKL